MCRLSSILLILLVLPACQNSRDTIREDGHFDNVILPELRRLETADPAKEVEAAWSRNDRRFLGILGFDLYAPGINKTDWKIDPVKDVRLLDDQGCIVWNEEHQHLREVAVKYADRYNRLLLAKLKEIPLSK